MESQEYDIDEADNNNRKQQEKMFDPIYWA